MKLSAWAAVAVVASLSATTANSATFDVTLGAFGWLRFDAHDSDADGRITDQEVSAFEAYLSFGTPFSSSWQQFGSTALGWLDIGLSGTVLGNALDRVAFDIPGSAHRCFNMQGVQRDFLTPAGRVEIGGGAIHGTYSQPSYQELNDPAYCDGTSLGAISRQNFGDSFGSATMTATGLAAPSPTPVPLPGTLALMSGAILGVGAIGRRRRRG
ncbi:hypothetical protein MLD63_15100 [Paracoccus sp. TK19116]|uniref:VPLPA-CTERM sorting domain-containing protein n=1 Tax=Paracoccus albicereus TaxID=2922394 RepID=A0ABT1MTW9_9RHOB|nr:hypothetical protein [Paracoccus albicereus]MCQ0971750.1 hypothetical protein [Paracoccus albicereus]